MLITLPPPCAQCPRLQRADPHIATIAVCTDAADSSEPSRSSLTASCGEGVAAGFLWKVAATVSPPESPVFGHIFFFFFFASLSADRPAGHLRVSRFSPRDRPARNVRHLEVLRTTSDAGKVGARTPNRGPPHPPSFTIRESPRARRGSAGAPGALPSPHAGPHAAPPTPHGQPPAAPHGSQHAREGLTAAERAELRALCNSALQQAQADGSSPEGLERWMAAWRQEIGGKVMLADAQPSARTGCPPYASRRPALAACCRCTTLCPFVNGWSAPSFPCQCCSNPCVQQGGCDEPFYALGVCQLCAHGDRVAWWARRCCPSISACPSPDCLACLPLS